MSIQEEYSAKWIWRVREETEVNQYVEFRRDFRLDEMREDNARLFISADSDYAVWINGQLIGCGQYSDYPDEKTYDVYDITAALHRGTNSIGILAYYSGRTCFIYKKGYAGLLFAIEAGAAVIVSDESTRCRKSPAYRGGNMYEITPQLSFAFSYDASADDGWHHEDYQMTECWKSAAVVAARETTVLKARPIEKLVIHKKNEVRVIAQGYFIRDCADGITVAEMMQTDYLSPCPQKSLFAGDGLELPSETGLSLNGDQLKGKTGAYILLDLGSEEAGLLSLDVDAEEGAVVDIAYGEHLDDLRVRAHTGGRNFAFRTTYGSGRKEFTHYFRRLGCRYIELHISHVGSKFTLYYAGLKAVEYPLEVRGQFSCPDSLHNRISEVCVKTLRLCMHEHYEDCPWREQALYGMDSRNQALCGYYCFGEYDFPQASFELLGKSLHKDGYLEIVAPSAFHVTIPSFSMAWILEVYELYLYSGRVEAVKKFLPWIHKMVDAYTTNLSDCLLLTPKGERYWHFYEWAEGLDGAGRDGFAVLQDDRLDAPLNLFFCIALTAASKLADAVGDEEIGKSYRRYAEGIRQSFHEKFWDETAQAYTTYVGQNVGEKHFSELTQSLALYAGACPPPLAANLR